jgi:hypothetical protein
MDRRGVLALLAAVTVTCAESVAAQTPEEDSETRASHLAWVVKAMTQMDTIRPGMTRAQLLIVFTTEGGLSTRLHRTFVSQDCPFFKVDIDFKAAEQTGEPSEKEFLNESDADIILKISRPYLQGSVMD